MSAARIDWSFGPGHGPISGVINAAGSALSLTMVADLAQVSPVWGFTAGAAAAAGAVASAAAQNAPGRALAYRALCWLGAGSWSAYALATATAEPWSGPWSTSSLAALAVGTIGAAYTGAAFQRAELRAEQMRETARQAMVAAELARLQDADAERAALGAEDRIAVEWRQRIKRVCGIDIDPHPERGIVAVELWAGDPSPGFTIDGNMPPGAGSWRRLVDHEDALAADARLPEGCSVKVEAGTDRGAFLIKVMTRNALTEDKPYPRDYPHESINQPRLIAYRANDDKVKVSLRQDVMLVVGPTGSGKTNTMNVVVAEHVKCVDVILCAIDFNGGSIAIPWLMPWRADPQGCPRPPFDWVADTPEKALVMTEAILDVVKDRKQAYAHLKVAANETLLPISANIPQFTIVIDEVAEVLGVQAQRDPIVRQVADNVLELQRIGRDSGGRLIISALGATNETLGARAVKIHSNVKLAMAGTPKDEIGYLMDTYKVAPEDVETAGSAHIKLRQDWPFIGKIPYLKPEQIAEIACATSDRRPAPDDRALQVMGRRWADRWKNSRALLELLDAGVEAMRAGGDMANAVAVAVPEQRTASNDQATPIRQDGGPREDVKPLGEALADLEAARRRLADIEPVPDPGPSADDLPELPEAPDFSVVESWLAPGMSATDATGKRKPLPQKRMHQLVWDAGDAGIGPTEVHKALKAEGYDTVYQTVNGWMKADAKQGILHQAADRAPYTRGPKMTNPYEG